MTKVTEKMPVEMVPGKLYALGATVSQNGDIHWVAKGRTGDAALNAYLLIEGSNGILIDTSYTIIGDILVRQLKSFGLEGLKIVYTRAVEFDSICNTEAILDTLPVSEIWSHFAASDWSYMHTPNPLPKPTYADMTFGVDGDVSLGEDRVLESINSKLKLLNAAWLYDAKTKTLFTSDAFSHAMAPEPGVQVVTDANDNTTADNVFEHLRTKFRWVEGANTTPLYEFVHQTFDKYDVEHIAPTNGCAISGRDLVAKHVQFVLDGLVKLSAKEDANV